MRVERSSDMLNRVSLMFYVDMWNYYMVSLDKDPILLAKASNLD